MLSSQHASLDEPTYPLAAAIFDYTKTTVQDRDVARAQMAQLLHRSLVLLVMHHFDSHGWAYDHKLSDADAMVAMDPRLFSYGLFYSLTEFTICSNLPRPERQPGGHYQWVFENTLWTSYAPEMPLTHFARIVLLNAMLAVEQHTYELSHLIYP